MPEPTEQVVEQDPYSELTEEITSEQTEKAPAKQAKEPKQKIQLDREEPEKGQTSDVLTSDDVKRIGLSDTFIGRPYKESIEEAYKNAVKWDHKNSQMIADLQRKMEELGEKFSQKDIKKAEEVVEEKLPDFEKIISEFIDEDGFVINRAGLAKAIDDFQNKKQELLKKELLKEVQKQKEPTDQTLQEIQKERYQADLYDEVHDQLSDMYEDEITPEIVNSVLGAYGDFLSSEDKETQKQYTALYQGKPKKLAKDIILFHKANRKPQKSQTEDAEKAALEAHEKQKQKLKNTEKTFVKSAASGRDTDKKVSKEDEAYVDVINDAMDSYDNAERFGRDKE